MSRERGGGARAPGAPWSDLAIDAVAGVALAAAFPEPGWWLLALPALAMVAHRSVVQRPFRSFVSGAVAGAVFYGLLVRWFASAIVDFTDFGRLAAFGAVAFCGIGIGLFVGAISWCSARISSRFGRGAGLASFAVLWIGYELCRETVPAPFPWGVLSASVARFGPAIDAAALIGASGVSLLLASGAAAIAAAERSRRGSLVAIAIWLAVVLAAWGGGLAVRSGGGENETREVRVAVTQGSLPRSMHPLDRYSAYVDLTTRAAEAGAELVVWPESATDLRLDVDRRYRDLLSFTARQLGVDLLVGSLTGTSKDDLKNSVGLVRADLGPTSIADKLVLVPFGEYVPFRPLFGDLPVVAAVPGDLKPGDAPVVHEGRSVRVGALVCYESVYPAISQSLAGLGAELLANVTNDSWFGVSSGAEQHLHHGLLRAAETGLPMVRAANNGISAIVDGRGRVVQELGTEERGFLVEPLAIGGTLLPGARVGRSIQYGCATLSGLLILVAIFPSTRTPRRRAAKD